MNIVLLLTLWNSQGYALPEPKDLPEETTLHQSRSDVAWTKRIRKTIAKDPDLSSDARNVKIFINGGMVTLQGSVRSEKEKQQVAELTERVVNRKSILNELTIGGTP